MDSTSGTTRPGHCGHGCSLKRAESRESEAYWSANYAMPRQTEPPPKSLSAHPDNFGGEGVGQTS
jgi:hypothetical protein